MDVGHALDIDRQHAGQRRDGNVKEISDRQVLGLEIDTDHRAELEVDEKQ